MTKHFDTYICNTYDGELYFDAHQTLTISPSTPAHRAMLHQYLDKFIDNYADNKGACFSVYVTDYVIPKQLDLF